ncbi:hypothetical protein LAZ67_21001715 [Cordylochernes scorpioides]|uniref:Receptor ligand binding region domain-containing protein n=1 Tax=Cordylochernes scorpioides TaxID=51811 RepID=A0ABY6LP15_9ARAC|nr:hypothetical protein LAZ67_21001715 [Cordylochernes scorpioides]
MPSKQNVIIILNRIRTSTGRCNYLLNKWNMSPDHNCDCGQIQTMHHILRDCPRRFFQGTLGDIHRCTEEALEWIRVNQNDYLNIAFSVRRFVWIGSDAWGGRSNVVHRLELVVEGAISVSPLVRPLAGFDEYFTSLTPLEAAEHNPWFAEFWEEHFQCELPEQPDTPFSEKYPRWCSSSKRLSAASGYRQVPSLHFVRDAVYAFAYALHNMHADKCGGKPGLCEELRSIEGQELRKYIEKVTFKDLIETENNDSEFLKTIITGDETRCFLFDPQTKKQSLEWHTPSSLRKKKVRLDKSKGKWKLLHDNVPAHRAIIVQDYLAKHSVSVLPHPPYSPDIAPCDFFFLPKLKMTLKGRRFSSSSEVIENATVELTKLRKK